jgi:hypothetical protein
MMTTLLVQEEKKDGKDTAGADQETDGNAITIEEDADKNGEDETTNESILSSNKRKIWKQQ